MSMKAKLFCASNKYSRRAWLQALLAALAVSVATRTQAEAENLAVGPGPFALLIQDDPTGPRDSIDPAGQRLGRLLDGMNVEAHWPAGFPIDWRTGEVTGPREITPGGHTHCSAFAAAVAERMGVYLLRPPAHGQQWLANAQAQWLNGIGNEGPMRARDAGWLRIGALSQPDTSERAIARANQGHLVVAVYFQPPENGIRRAGHIAIVRPSNKAAGLVRLEGPDVIQAGKHNHRIVPMVEGFADHKAGWRNGTIEYFRNRAVA
jgi:hypothetical protein